MHKNKRTTIIVAALVAILALPIVAQGAGTSLSDLAAKVNRLIRKTRYLSAVTGKIAARYVTISKTNTSLTTTNLQMAIEQLDDTITSQQTAITNQKQAANIVYANTASGLSATTLQAAVDAVGAGLDELLLKKGEVADGTLPTTTWKGYHYSYGNASDPAVQSDEISLIFSPTSASAGTFTITPKYAFDFHGSSLGTCGSTGPYTGNYELVEGMIYTFLTKNASGASCASSIVATTEFSTKGKTAVFVTNRTIPNEISVFTRQD